MLTWHLILFIKRFKLYESYFTFFIKQMKIEVIVTGLAILFIVGLLYKQKEGFGSTSPGTMVQLRTSHVPTEEDLWYATIMEPKRIRAEITRMTGSDPGNLVVNIRA